MKKPLLVMFVGTPGSGKTTFARLLAEKLDAVALNSDAVRRWMWGSVADVKAAHADPEARSYNNQLSFGALDYAAAQILAAGNSVVYDANANKPAERVKLANIAEKHGGKAVVVRINTPPEVAIKRIADRADTHDQRQHDEEKARGIVYSFAKLIEEPTEAKHVVQISGELPFEEQYAVFEQAASTIEQPHKH